MSDFRAQIKAILNLKGIPDDIKKIESEKIKLSNFTVDAEKIKRDIQNALKDIKIDINVGGKGGNSGIDKTTEKITKLKTVMDKINNYSLDASISKVTMKYSQYAGSGHAKLREIETDLKEIYSIQNKLNSGSSDNMVKDYNKLQSILKKVQNNLTIVSSEGSKAVSSLQVKNLDNKIQAWCNNNTKAVKVYGEAIEELRKNLQNVTDVKGLNNISNQFKAIQTEAKATGNYGKSLTDQFKSAAASMTGFVTAGAALGTIITAVKDGVSDVIELDTALVDLQKTTTATASELNKFYEDANNIAKKYGETTRGIIQSTADWSRLGYNLNDSKLMAQYSSMFKSISPGMTIDTATTGLVSVMKAYGLEAQDVLDGVMSKINAVGNTAATSNDQIIDGLQRSASAMSAMDTSLDKTIALFTAGQEVIQDSSQVGTALKSISLRIRGYNEETEQLDESLVNLTGDVIDLTKAASNDFKGISLFTDETQTEYKDIYDYLKEIAGVIDEIDAKSKQELIEKLFGKNRSNTWPYVHKCA